MPKVSVIVPVYKVEPYLKKCVESLIKQSLEDIEIILVDDGSPDTCPQICDEFARQDKRIVVIHKPNGGLSDARNVGVKHATSDYVIFVDSDDYVEVNMCERLYQHAITQKADIVTSLVNEIKDGVRVGNKDAFDAVLLNKEEALQAMLSGQKITLYAVGKIYKKELLEKVPYVVGKLYEDAFTTPYIINEASRVYATSERLYNYLRRNDSITLARYSKRDLDCIEAHEHNLEFIKNNYPNLIEEAKFRYFWSLLYINDKMLINHEFSHEVWHKIKSNRLAMWKNKYLSRNRKISIIIMFISKKLYLKLLKKIG